jgi:diadenosine tetraphosphate (Ap4A) HIT family hydrolase
MTTVACRACGENDAAEHGDDPWAVARLETGVVRLNPTQYHRGATFFVSTVCVAELHELDPRTRATHLEEMAEVAHAVFRYAGPRKMNYEALGNSVAHLHWWITPRHHDDPRPGGPIWEDLDFLRAQRSGDSVPAEAERDHLRLGLLTELRRAPVAIHRSFL